MLRFWCFDVENSCEGDSEIVSWSFNSSWKHRVIWMMFFQFRQIYKGFLLCRYELFARKFDSAKRRRKSLKGDIRLVFWYKFKSFKNSIFDVLPNRILIWHSVSCIWFKVFVLLSYICCWDAENAYYYVFYIVIINT